MNSQLSGGVEPFLISPDIKLRVASKIVLNCLCPFHVAMQVLEKEELEFIFQKLKSLSAHDNDCIPIADLLALLIAYAYHSDNRRIMLEGNFSDILSDLIESGTEVEQSLVAKLSTMMLSDSSDAPVSSIASIPEIVNDHNTSQDLGKFNFKI